MTECITYVKFKCLMNVYDERCNVCLDNECKSGYDMNM